MPLLITVSDPDLLRAISDDLYRAAQSQTPVRFWVDEMDSAVKIKVGEGMWSPPMGTGEYRP